MYNFYRDDLKKAPLGYNCKIKGGYVYEIEYLDCYLGFDI